MNNYRNTPEYREWKEKVKKRDGNLCRSCQNKYYLDVHHIFRVESHPQLSDHIDNGITLCKQCHAKLKNKENDIDFLIAVVTEPLREHMDRLSQTLISLEGVVNIRQSEDSLMPDDDLLDSDLIVIPSQFDDVGDFSEGLAKIGVDDSDPRTYGYINKSGEIVIPPRFDDVGDFSEGLAYFIVDGDWDSEADWWDSGKYGYINRSGEIVIPPRFDIFEHLGNFSEGLARFFDIDSNDYGYINKSGEIVIPPQFLAGGDFSEGLAYFCDRDSDKYGYIDRSGEIVIPPQFDFVRDFSEGLASFRDRDSDKYGFIDQSGEIVIPPQFGDVVNFSEGLASFRITDVHRLMPTDLIEEWIQDGSIDPNELLYGYIDQSGEIVIPPQFNFSDDYYTVNFYGAKIGGFSEGLTGFRDSDSGKYGFIDQSGEIVIPPQFGDVVNFSEGLAKIRFGHSDSDKYGFIRNPLNT